MNQPNLNLDINQTTGVVCDECGHAHFQQVLVIRKASGLLSGTGKPVFACNKCGHVNNEFLPKEVKDLD